MSNRSIEQELQALKSDYLTALPDVLAEMRQLLIRLREKPDSDLIKQLRLLAHRIKGTAGTYGYAAIGARSAELEHSLNAAQTDPGYAWDRLSRQLDALQHEIELADSGFSVIDSNKNRMNEGHVMIVDDDPDFLNFLSAILRQHGFKVSTITDPKIVLTTALEKQPDLLLIDVEMPHISGYQLCQLLKQHEQIWELPVIFLTAHEAPDYRIAAFRSGGDDFITKPIINDELIARVGVRIAKAKLMREKQDILQQLQSQHESLLSILNQLQIGTVLIDPEGMISFISQSCKAIGSIGIEQATGLPWQQAFPFNQKALQDITKTLENNNEGRPLLHLSWRCGGRQYFVDCEIKEVPTRPGFSLFYLYDQSELYQLRQQIEQNRFHHMVGNSEPMRQMYKLIEQVARGDWNVMIEGETGVGKELVAQSLHAASSRKDKPFIAVNSAGLSETLLSSQLFGHRRGAFTGAVGDQEGFFEAASGGTLFLDEIGDIPLTMQASLLRVVQEREIIRLGESRPRKVDVRIIAATHKDLVEEVKAGRFREDLFYRLRVARIYVPPLRERLVDVPILAQAFLAESCRIARIPLKQIGREAMDLLQKHNWPGNVRELKATIDYSLIRSQGDQLTIEDLPPELLTFNKADLIGSTKLNNAVIGKFSDTVRIENNQGEERARIMQALAQANGNRTLAAKMLGIGRATLYRRLSVLGIG